MKVAYPVSEVGGVTVVHTSENILASAHPGSAPIFPTIAPESDQGDPPAPNQPSGHQLVRRDEIPAAVFNHILVIDV